MFKEEEWLNKDKNSAWLDISAYPTRTYIFPNGKIEVTDCRKLSVRFSTLGGHAHRIITRKKGCHTEKAVFIPAGWICIEWDVPKGVDAFVF